MMVLRSMPDTIHAVLLSSIRYMVAVVYERTRPDRIVKYFDFDLTFDVIGGPEVNKIRFPTICIPNLSNAFELCKSV